MACTRKSIALRACDRQLATTVKIRSTNRRPRSLSVPLPTQLAEVDRYAPPEPTAADVDREVQVVRSRFPSAEAFDAVLARSGIDLADRKRASERAQNVLLQPGDEHGLIGWRRLRLGLDPGAGDLMEDMEHGQRSWPL